MDTRKDEIIAESISNDYKSAMKTFLALKTRADGIKASIDDKKKTLDSRALQVQNLEAATKLNNIDAILLKNKIQIDPKARQHLNKLKADNIATLNTALMTANNAINDSIESLRIINVGINQLLDNAQRVLTTFEVSINNAKTESSLIQLQGNFKSDINQSVDRSRITADTTLTEQAINNLNVTLSSAAPVQQAYLNEIRKQISIATIVLELASFRSLIAGGSNIDHEARQVRALDLMAKINMWIDNNSELAKMPLIKLDNQPAVSIVDMFYQLKLNLQKANQENLQPDNKVATTNAPAQPKRSTDELLATELNKDIDRNQKQRVNEAQHKHFDRLIARFEVHAKNLNEHKKGKKSDRSEPISRLISWITLQRDRNESIYKTLSELDKNPDYQKIIAKKKLSSSTLENQLITTIAAFKAQFEQKGNDNKPLSQDAPSSTTRTKSSDSTNTNFEEAPKPFTSSMSQIHKQMALPNSSGTISQDDLQNLIKEMKEFSDKETAKASNSPQPQPANVQPPKPPAAPLQPSQESKEQPEEIKNRGRAFGKTGRH